MPKPVVDTTIVVCAMLWASLASAQTWAGGSCFGRVTDGQGLPLQRAEVTAVGESGPGHFATTTDESGSYRLLDLPPDTYRITVDHPGFRRLVRHAVVTRVGLTVRLDLALSVGPTSETVDVTGDTPLLETRSATQAFNLAGEFIALLPLGSGREWSDLLSITPGVTVRSVGALSTSHAVRGSDVGSNVIQVDGANIASAAIGSTATVNLVPGAIADVEVKTAAVDAASPLGVGAMISVASKSGGNDARGALTLDFQHERWSAHNVEGGTTGAVAAIVPEVTLGGPLRRDRLWLFGAYRFERSRQGIPRTPEQLRTLAILAPSFAPFDLRYGGHTALVKASARLSTRHRAELLYQYMPRETSNAGPTDAGLFQTLLLGGERNWSGRVTSTWGPRVLTRWQASYSDNAQQNRARLDAPARRIFASVTPSGGRLTGSRLVATLDNGGTGMSGEQRFSRTAVSGDVSLFLHGRAGAHEMQAGSALERQHEESTAVFANGGSAREESVLIDPLDVAAGVRPYWREAWNVIRQATGLGTSDDLAFYVQDRWQPTSRLLVSVGIRADVIRRRDDLFDAIVQRGTALGPRLGVVYALTRDGRHALRASWTRVHDALSNNRAAGGANSAGKTDFFDLNLDGVFETQLVTPPSNAASRNRVFDPSREQPYVDEWSLGYRAQLPTQVSLDVGFARRTYRHRTAAIETNGIYDGVVFRGYRDETQNEIYTVTGNRWNWPVYEGVEIRATRRSRAIEAVAGYTRAWRHLAGDWQPNDPAAVLQPSTFANDRGIGGVRAPIPMDANSLSGTHMTADNLPWADHALNLGVAWQGPWRVRVATTAIVQSGAWSGPIVTRIAAPDPRYGPPMVRLSNGRMVSNLLATTIRFAHPTRGDGQLQAPPLRIWNLRLGYPMWQQDRRSLELSLDIFNVTNRGAGTTFAPSANQTFSADFGRLANMQPPRAARLLARVIF
jgi:hypothetical protein